MKVFLLKDVERVGIPGEIIKVKEGYATNFLVPKKLGVVITNENEQLYLNKVKTIENRKEAVATKTSMLAEKIKALKITLKRKMHDKEKLYGAINSSDIVNLLDTEGIKISKNQVELEKPIKKQGSFEVTVKLSNQLKPKFLLKVISE